MEISADTKISSLIEHNPASIDAICSINRRFEKLRNPILRKVLASRVTLADAAKIGGCSVNDFFEKLQPLGFNAGAESPFISALGILVNELPEFMQKLNSTNAITLDVRTDLESGKDPFRKIMDTIYSLPQDNFLIIVNSFEPVPLINLLRKKGFSYYSEEPQKGLFYTYFINDCGYESDENLEKMVSFSSKNCEFSEMLNKYKENTIVLDVKNLEMPLPMVTILQELDKLPESHALFVHHKKVPQFLLPELKEKNYLWLIREDGVGDVKLLIFR